MFVAGFDKGNLNMMIDVFSFSVCVLLCQPFRGYIGTSIHSRTGRY